MRLMSAQLWPLAASLHQFFRTTSNRRRMPVARGFNVSRRYSGSILFGTTPAFNQATDLEQMVRKFKL